MSRFRDTGNGVYSVADWNDYLLEAQADVYAASPWWPFFEGLATNTITTSGEVTLPTDAWRVNSVYNATDDYALSPLSGRADYLAYYPDPDASVGSPLHYRLRSNVLEVLPHPQSPVSIRVEYMVPPAFLAADGDEPIFPEQYHQILVSGALARAYEDDGNVNMAQTHWAKFGALLSQMKDDLLDTRSESYYGIPDIW